MVQQIADHASPAGSAPAVCGSLTSAAPGAPADWSVSPPVQGQPSVGFDASRARRLEAWHRVSGHGAPACTLYRAGQFSDRDAAGGTEPLTAAAVPLFGLSPDS